MIRVQGCTDYILSLYIPGTWYAIYDWAESRSQRSLVSRIRIYLDFCLERNRYRCLTVGSILSISTRSTPIRWHNSEMWRPFCSSYQDPNGYYIYEQSVDFNTINDDIDDDTTLKCNGRSVVSAPTSLYFREKRYYLPPDTLLWVTSINSCPWIRCPCGPAGAAKLCCCGHASTQEYKDRYVFRRT